MLILYTMVLKGPPGNSREDLSNSGAEDRIQSTLEISETCARIMKVFESSSV